MGKQILNIWLLIPKRFCNYYLYPLFEHLCWQPLECHGLLYHRPAITTVKNTPALLKTYNKQMPALPSCSYCKKNQCWGFVWRSSFCIYWPWWMNWDFPSSLWLNSRAAHGVHKPSTEQEPRLGWAHTVAHSEAASYSAISRINVWGMFLPPQTFCCLVFVQGAIYLSPSYLDFFYLLALVN